MSIQKVNVSEFFRLKKRLKKFLNRFGVFRGFALEQDSENLIASKDFRNSGEKLENGDTLKVKSHFTME